MNENKEFLWEMYDMTPQELIQFILYCWSRNVVPKVTELKVWKKHHRKNKK